MRSSLVVCLVLLVMASLFSACASPGDAESAPLISVADVPATLSEEQVVAELDRAISGWERCGYVVSHDYTVTFASMPNCPYASLCDGHNLLLNDRNGWFGTIAECMGPTGHDWSGYVIGDTLRMLVGRTLGVPYDQGMENYGSFMAQAPFRCVDRVTSKACDID